MTAPMTDERRAALNLAAGNDWALFPLAAESKRPATGFRWRDGSTTDTGRRERLGAIPTRCRIETPGDRFQMEGRIDYGYWAVGRMVPQPGGQYRTRYRQVRSGRNRRRPESGRRTVDPRPGTP